MTTQNDSPKQETFFLNRPQGRVAVEVRGTGPAVVCVPGIGDTRSSYRHLAPLLAASGHAVYVMDLRGHGDSEVTFDSWSAADIGDDIVALLEERDLSDACLVGCSIGGGAVCWAAAEAPARVSSLVLLNPFVRDMPADRWMRPLVPLLFGGPWGRWAWKKYRTTLFTTEPADHDTAEPAVHANLAEPGRMGAMRGMLRASKANVHDRLQSITQPALVLMGAADPDYSDPAVEGQTIVGMLGGPASSQLIDEVGHYPQAERPQITADLLLAHVESRLAP